MSAILPATRSARLLGARWTLTTALSLGAVVLTWQLGVLAQSRQTRPVLGEGCPELAITLGSHALHDAIGAYRLLTGRFPDTLQALVDENLIPASEIRPPGCEEPFRYQLLGTQYQLYAPIR
jgi:hypothetical protein